MLNYVQPSEKLSIYCNINKYLIKRLYTRSSLSVRLPNLFWKRAII